MTWEHPEIIKGVFPALTETTQVKVVATSTSGMDSMVKQGLWYIKIMYIYIFMYMHISTTYMGVAPIHFQVVYIHVYIQICMYKNINTYVPIHEWFRVTYPVTDKKLVRDPGNCPKNGLQVPKFQESGSWRNLLILPLHPGRLTWNLQITHLERKMIFQPPMIMFHVNLQGCRYIPQISVHMSPEQRKLPTATSGNPIDHPSGRPCVCCVYTPWWTMASRWWKFFVIPGPFPKKKLDWKTWLLYWKKGHSASAPSKIWFT